MAKQLKGLKAYEQDICTMLNFESFDKISIEDMEGCYGVAMVMAHVLDGVASNIFDFANWLNVNPALIEQPYQRLKINGIFGSVYNARKDEALLMGITHSKKSQQLDIGDDSEMSESYKAYGFIYGIASGQFGIR